jgi:hypothetical protein
MATPKPAKPNYNPLGLINEGANDHAFPQHYTQMTNTVNTLLQRVAALEGASAAPAAAPSSGLSKESAIAIATARGL